MLLFCGYASCYYCRADLSVAPPLLPRRQGRRVQQATGGPHQRRVDHAGEREMERKPVVRHVDAFGEARRQRAGQLAAPTKPATERTRHARFLWAAPLLDNLELDAPGHGAGV